MNRLLCGLVCYLMTSASLANSVVNVYAWGGVIPKKVIQQFEHETGITVHFSTYDSNETLYAKLKSSQKTIYDVVLPSGYYVERMQQQNMLEKLDSTQLPNLENIDPFFKNQDYDPGNQYSVPLVWGATGIFYNHTWINKAPTTWNALWNQRFKGQLMLLDDPREVFSIALLSLGYSPNDDHPDHIKQAYQKLLTLIPNIKLFASDGIQAIMIDEDAIAGATWNNDALKAQVENKAIQFVYPKEGFVIWVDCLAIPRNPPHPLEAYQFINFMLKASSSVAIARDQHLAITNQKGKTELPMTTLSNEMIYPSPETLKRSHVQQDVGENTIALYNHYWQDLKLAF